MGCHLQLRGKVLELQFVKNAGRRAHHDFHCLQALFTNLAALAIDILDQTLGGSLEEVAELLLGELQCIQQAIQNARILAIPLARLSC